MRDIDFLSSNGKDSTDENESRQYDIEYSTPIEDQAAQSAVKPKIKPKKNWFGFFTGRKQQSIPTQSALSDSSAVATDIVSADTRTPNTPKQKFQIPLAPPPPVHARPVPLQAMQPTIQPTMHSTIQKPAQKPVQKPVQQPAQKYPQKPIQKPIQSSASQVVPLAPVQPTSKKPAVIPVAPPAPQPPAPQPIISKPAPPAAPALTGTRPATPANGSVDNLANGKVHTQRVADIHGVETDPERMSKGMSGVNLLPQDSVSKREHDPASTRLLKVALATLSVVTVGYFGMVLYQSYFLSQTKQVHVEIDKVEQEIFTYKDLQTQVNDMNDIIEQVSGILDAHIYWTQFFQQLEQYTLPNVHYISFSGNVSGQINIQAETTDFASVSRQLAVFEQATDFVTSVSSNTATRTSQSNTEDIDSADDSATDASDVTPVDETVNSRVTFAINLQINPDIFYYRSYYQSNESN